EGAAKPRIAARRLEARRHLANKAFEREVRYRPYHGIIGSRHPQVRDEGGPIGQDALVGGLHVRVCPNDRAYLTIYIPGEGLLLRRGFGVKIDEDDFGFLADPLDGRRSDGKGAIRRGHVNPALQIYDSQAHAAPAVANEGAGAGRGG